MNQFVAHITVYRLHIPHYDNEIKWSYVMMVAGSPTALACYERRRCTECLGGLADQQSSCT